MINPNKKETHRPALLVNFTNRTPDSVSTDREFEKIGKYINNSEPIYNDPPSIIDQVIEELLKRKQKDKDTESNNEKDALRDAFDKSLDLALSLYQAIVERDEN